EAFYAALLVWQSPEGETLLEQTLAVALRPAPEGGHEIELQSTFRPPDGRDRVALGKTNFGFLAVRMAKSLSVHFGQGALRNSEGAVGEEAIFGQTARWVDYSGPVAVGEGEARRWVREGITF